MAHGKKYLDAAKLVDHDKLYDPAEAAQRPLNEFQRTMIQQAFTAETLGPIKPQKKIMVSAIQTEQDAAEYLAEVNDKIRKTRKK